MMLGAGGDLIGSDKRERSFSRMSAAVYLVIVWAASAYSANAQSTNPPAMLDPEVFPVVWVHVQGMFLVEEYTYRRKSTKKKKNNPKPSEQDLGRPV